MKRVCVFCWNLRDAINAAGFGEITACECVGAKRPPIAIDASLIPPGIKEINVYISGLEDVVTAAKKLYKSGFEPSPDEHKPLMEALSALK